MPKADTTPIPVIATRGSVIKVHSYNTARMRRTFTLVGGLLFAGSLLFFGFRFGWRFEDSGPWSLAAGWRPVVIDVLLFSVFGLHHSLFARTPLKAWVARVWPPELERSIYVWIASVLFLAVCAAWQPVPGALWRISGLPALLGRGLQVAGVILSVVAARHLDALSLAGIRQARHEAWSAPALDETGPYALVRHPIYLGWFLMVWGAPEMTGTRLIFAATSCVYLLLAITFEERDLQRTFGAAYEQYTRRVRWKVLPGLH
jgi:protein-S-isoprenylcysteine O-methyltransferase Ste14